LRKIGRKMVLAAILGIALSLLGASGQTAAQAPPQEALKELDLGLSYVQRAWVARSDIQGMTHKTLCVEMKQPTAVLSTLEGYKTGVWRVANHYVPYGAWKTLAMQSVPQLMDTFWRSLGFQTADGAMLITGADMDNLALKRASSDGIEVVALVTAGVRGNAMRAGFDQGKHQEPGTINAIILTNRKLSPRAMTRAMIGVTEAKTAALQDLDVRSRYQPRKYQATGTGTDNLIIVQGEGTPARLSGGHSKLGELMAKAMYAGVKEAIARQNRLLAGRDVLDRLKERGLSLASLSAGDPAGAARLELIAARPYFTSFLEQALALDDARNRGLLQDLIAWRDQCVATAARCSAKTPPNLDQAQGPLAMALAVLSSCGKGSAATK